MEFHGITIYKDPRRGSVRRLEDLETAWYLEHLPLNATDQKLTISKAFEKAAMEDPKLFMELKRFNQDKASYKEIMLATVLTYDGIVELEDTLSVHEFDELVQICKDATGGVHAFFGESSSGINLKSQTTKPEKHGYMN